MMERIGFVKVLLLTMCLIFGVSGAKGNLNLEFTDFFAHIFLVFMNGSLL